MEENAITQRIIGAAIEVHRELGPGLLESAYELALAIEFDQRGIGYRRQCLLPARYKGQNIGDAYRLDFLVEDAVIVEIKAVSRLAPVHGTQLLTYLRLANKRIGLLLNFHVDAMRSGIQRIVAPNAAS